VSGAGPTPAAEAVGRSRRTASTAGRLAALLLVVVVSVGIFALRAEVATWAQYGYLGIFLASVLANGTVLLPAPGVALVAAMGGVLNPLLVSLAAGLGASIGEMVGYMAGVGGQLVVERVALYDRLLQWMQRYGSLTIFVLAAVPNPFFDLAGMAAGSLRVPVRRFFLWCLLGKIVKMLAFAYSGALAVRWLGGAP
jgi:uncharacterized membrane protein YdjX (TVP38/TMEM64 family)